MKDQRKVNEQKNLCLDYIRFREVTNDFLLSHISRFAVSPGTPPNSAFSVQAQAVLAEILAPLLDVSYGSQEKERVVTLLTNLMYNVTPYLKNHTYVAIVFFFPFYIPFGFVIL